MDYPWQKIKAEYITDAAATYRSLSEKYGVPLGTLQKRAKKENWPLLKKQSGDRTDAKAVAVLEARNVQKIARLHDITDKLLDKLEQAVDELDTQVVTHSVKTKVIEYNNDLRPDKPTKETITEEEQLIAVQTIIDRSGLKSITAALRDIKEVQMLKSSDDVREQNARIAVLEERTKEEDSGEVVVMIESDTEEYCK